MLIRVRPACLHLRAKSVRANSYERRNAKG
jgi:hypothetical protein